MDPFINNMKMNVSNFNFFFLIQDKIFTLT